MEFCFGIGDGWLDESKVIEVLKAIDHADDVALTNYTDAQCNCGYGCSPHTCDDARRHWFTGPNCGDPFDGWLSTEVDDALLKAGIR